MTETAQQPPGQAEVDAFLALLPKLAFFLPTIPPHDVTVNDKTYHLREQVVGLLWLIDEITIDSTCCRLAELRRIFNHWWPAESKASEQTNLSHYLDELIEADLVDEDFDELDRRKRLVRLTPSGRAILATAKEKRRLLLHSLLGAISPEDRAQTMRVARTVADAAWRLLKRPLRLP